MSLAMKPVEVVVLERVKLNKNKIWVTCKDASDDAEAIIRHVSSTLYVLEVKKRGTSTPVFKFDFVEIRSYRMKTNTWHELRHEDDKKYALRFKEGDRNFQAFFEQLQVVLKLHNKFTKPKYNGDFMKEVKMFKLEMLTPVDKSNKGRKARSSDDKTGRTSTGSNSSSGTSVGSGGGSSTVLPRLLIGSNSGESFPKWRNGNNSSTPARKVENWRLPPERPESSDESHSDRGSSIDEETFYSGSEHYSDSSSTAEFTYDPQMGRGTSGRPSPGRPRPAAGGQPPPVPRRKCGEYVNIEYELGRSKPPPPTPPPPPPNPRNENQRQNNVLLVRAISDMPPQTSAGQDRQNQPVQRQTSLQDPSSPSSSSSVYGTAQSWRCVRCSLINRPFSVRCAACNWTRTDAWECRSCSAVYSVDVVHCQTCPAWRCRLCTYVNGGLKTATTVCDACLQK